MTPPKRPKKSRGKKRGQGRGRPQARKTTKKKVTPVQPEINTKPIEQVWYSDTLPALGEEAELVSVESLKERFGWEFEWEEIPKHPRRTIRSVGNLFDSLPKPNASLSKQLKAWLSQPNLDSLAIVNMGEVGHGVFAREDIAAGTIVALYSGVFERTAQDNEYAFDVDTMGGSSQFCFNAKSIGGIARFFQHLPESEDQDVAEMMTLLEQETPRELMGNLLFSMGIYSEKEQDAILTNFQYKLRKEGRDAVELDYRKFVRTKKQKILKSFHFEETQFEDPELKERVATSNLVAMTVMYGKKPYTIMIAARNIRQYEQLGFSYGLGYWLNRKIIPDLFDLKGQIIPKDSYQYRQLPISIRVPNKPSPVDKIFFYSNDEYREDSARKYPRQFAGTDCPMSFFRLKKRMVKHRVLSGDHGKLSIEEHPFADFLRCICPEDVKLELYYSHPESGDRSDFDIVCRTQTLERWAQLMNLLKPVLGSCSNFFQFSKEVLIRDINANRALCEGLQFMLMANPGLTDIFTQRIPKEALPREPEENDIVINKDGRYGVIPYSQWSLRN